jgi:hypothetical protein
MRARTPIIVPRCNCVQSLRLWSITMCLRTPDELGRAQRSVTTGPPAGADRAERRQAARDDAGRIGRIDGPGSRDDSRHRKHQARSERSSRNSKRSKNWRGRIGSRSPNCSHGSRARPIRCDRDSAIMNRSPRSTAKNASRRTSSGSSRGSPSKTIRASVARTIDCLQVLATRRPTGGRDARKDRARNVSDAPRKSD